MKSRGLTFISYACAVLGAIFLPVLPLLGAAFIYIVGWTSAFLWIGNKGEQ